RPPEPVGAFEERSLDPGRLAPGRPARVGVHPYPPPTHLAAAQGGRRPGYVERAGGLDHSGAGGVPRVGPVPEARAAGDLDLVPRRAGTHLSLRGGRSAPGARRPDGQADVVPLELDLLEGLPLVARRPQEPDDAADDEEAGEDPGQRLESDADDDGHEEAPDAEADPHDREHEALRGAAQQRGEELSAPELEERLRPESTTDRGQH